MNTNVYKIGFRAGIIAFAANALFIIAQSLQLLRLLSYPYDEILIYGFSLCIVLPFIIEILALHYVTENDNKFWSHAALIFTVMYAVFVSANYVVQLATVIPMNLKGEIDKVAVLVQYPHSMFWDFDAVGYICMGLASAFVLPLFKRQGFDKWVRIAFLANALVTPLIAFVYFYPDFSETILLLAIPWTITAPLMMLFLALWFKKTEAFKGSIYSK
ncbi:MAG: hypothetical protein JST46_16735 [Bacteroidetes bacterium]|nr:hypothetical protein [Bacteroidota bacterium]